jgi:hypothetical protein
MNTVANVEESLKKAVFADDDYADMSIMLFWYLTCKSVRKTTFLPIFYSAQIRLRPILQTFVNAVV